MAGGAQEEKRTSHTTAWFSLAPSHENAEAKSNRAAQTRLVARRVYALKLPMVRSNANTCSTEAAPNHMALRDVADAILLMSMRKMQIEFLLPRAFGPIGSENGVLLAGHCKGCLRFLNRV